ncbi:uncharacterized protein DUF4129 [Cellulomonas sp. SLBN-39]|nr:uncharacterized protein DUF4129 [Cellulomonas sp. SLBN-39]
MLHVPVEPDAATARRWALEELADPVYRAQESLLDRVLAWLSEMLQSLQGPALPSGTAALVVVGVVVVVVAVALWVAGPVRVGRARAARAGAVLTGDDRRTSAQLRTAADEASARGDHALAVTERYRAVVRGLEERAVLDERPGRTAHEAAQDAGRELPDVAGPMRDGGDVFDAVVYGGRRADAQDDARLRALDDAVRAARRRPVPVA